MDVAVGHGVDCVRLADLERRSDLMASVNRPLVSSLHRLAMGAELVMVGPIGEPFAFGLEEEGAPPDVMFRDVGMGNLFTQACLYREQLDCLDLVRAFTDGNVLLRLPVRLLKTLYQFNYHSASPFVLSFLVGQLESLPFTQLSLC